MPQDAPPTPRTSQQDLGYVRTRLNQVMHGWANYFRHALVKDTFSTLDHFAWWRVIRMLTERRRWGRMDVRRRFTTAAIPATRYRSRGSQIPGPWTAEPA
jgi:RNA-directed DNA polymerase